MSTLKNASSASESLVVGTCEVSGRIAMPPMGTYTCDDSTGYVSLELLDYYRSRAANPHVSLVFVEHSYVSFEGKAKPWQISIAEDGAIEGLSQLADAIHDGGALAFIQLAHAGAATTRAVVKQEPVSASPVSVQPLMSMGDLEAPHALDSAEIARVVEAFANAAARAKQAGFDGVEVHSAHGYLLNEFLSPLTNKRTDEYGGALQNRCRIHREVLAAVKSAVGKDFPISVRFGGCDYMEGGLTIEEGVEAALILEEAGADLISISGGMCRFILPGKTEPGYFADLSVPVRNACHIPIMLSGGVKTLAQADELLAKGAADMIGVGRQLLARANWEYKTVL